MMDESSIQESLRHYTELGMDTLPLAPGTKEAIITNWQSKDPMRLWRLAPQGANIAIRAGGDSQSAFLDCDEAKTFTNLKMVLAGLGYMPEEYPLAQTPGGYHIYARFVGHLQGDYCHLLPSIGAGEFRFGPGSYVVAPPSILQDGGIYRFLAGDLRQRPLLALEDVRDILSVQGTKSSQNRRRDLPRLAIALLHGQGIERYATRSEAEHAIIVSLVNVGLEFQTILELFIAYPCAGKFCELREKSERRAIGWLRRSYDEALQWVSKHESQERHQLKALIQWAQSKPWPGRTGAIDQAVFLAHALIAYGAGRLTYAASSRTLAEKAGIGHMTAARANIRLSTSSLIKIETPPVADSATIYRIFSDVHTDTLPHIDILGSVSVYTHDAFRQQGLGKAAAEVWVTLQVGPMSVRQLAAATGRHVSTIRRALGKMAMLVDTVTGELIPLVEVDGEKWHTCKNVDLDHVAEVVCTAGMGARQKERHAKERRAHRRDLLMGRKA